MVAVIAIAAAAFAIDSQGQSGGSTTLPPNPSGSSTVTTTSSLLNSPSSTTSSTLYPNPGGSSTVSTTSSQQSIICIISGQPGPMFLRVVSDSNQTPIAGAQVTATNNAAYCGSLPASGQTTVTFTTNGTEWYSLSAENNAGYSFVVEYSGHVYNFTARLAPVSATCATLFIPSGRTSVSILEFQTDSSACTSTTTTSSSSSSMQYGSLSWDANYGVWNYEVTLTTNQIQQGQNIDAIFSLTNFSNETQRIDVAGPLAYPVISSENGTIVWAYQPPSTNAFEDIAAGQSITQNLVLPTGMLSGGQSYTLSSYPGIITPDIGQDLELSQTITVGQTTTSTTTSSTTAAAGLIIIPQGIQYQVQSSYDCVAGSTNQTFSVTASSDLQGAISAGSPGVTIYVATVQEAGTTSMGHPAAWVYSSGLTNSTSFNVPLSAGSYVFWTEGADLGCGNTVVMPLEQLTTVTVAQAVTLMPT